jgi:hypothetical protein
MKYWWVNQNQTYKHEVSGGSTHHRRSLFYQAVIRGV